MMRLVTFLIISILANCFIYGQGLSGEEVIDRSIAFHDPENIWASGHFLFDLCETRPGVEDRNTLIEINNGTGFFCAIRTLEGYSVEHTIKDGQCIQSLNFDYDLTESEIETHNLTCERTNMLRNYYSYLWGLPMKLKDQGTIVNPVISKTNFNGSEVISVKVNYDPEVGRDTWYFYFDPETYTLEGYRFHHEEEKNDGEYIILEDLYDLGKMKIPGKRSWLVNKDDKFLGEDILENVRIIKSQGHQ